MDGRRCERCGATIRASKRSDARFCSTRCRVAEHRATQIPTEMRRTHRWVNHDEAKRPISPTNGRWASTTNPRTWSTLARARERSPRVGYVLGAGIGCIDLDHAIRDDGTLTEGARALVDAYPGNWIEVSPSGRGLHIWGRAEERTGFRKAWRGQAVEFYSQGRFITVTGRTFQRGQLEPL